MKVILFGATGMVGQGVLLECLESPRISEILSIGRRKTGRSHAKLKEIIHSNFSDYSEIEAQFAGAAACFFCLGISAFRLSEEKYHEITHNFPLRAAEALIRVSENPIFCLVSGEGADPSGKSPMMWARVKGKAENSLKKLPMKSVFFRPGYIQPVKKIVPSYGLLYKIMGPFYPLWKILFPGHVCTSAQIGRAMLYTLQQEPDEQIAHSPQIVRWAQSFSD